jgi:hypothetical protein
MTDPADPGTSRVAAVRCDCGWTGMCVLLENGSIDPEENCGNCGGNVVVVTLESVS